jgi:carbamoyl-phosphate synthase large subunit
VGLNFLITGAGGDVCLGILKSISNINVEKKIFVTGARSLNLSIIKKEIFFTKSPPVRRSKEYINFINQFIKDNKINFLIPCIDSELELYSKIRKFSFCKVIANKNNSIKLLSDKYKLIKFFKLKKVPTIPTEIATKNNIKNFNLPFVYKPRLGSGSKNISFINNVSQKKKLKINVKNKFILQKYIPGPDYTASFFVENKHIKNIVVFRRKLKNGRTIKAILVKKKIIHQQLKKIIRLINLDFGNIQFKIKDKKIFVYEVNPRFSGTIELQCLFSDVPKYIVLKSLFKKTTFVKNSIAALVAERVQKKWNIIRIKKK